MRNSFLYIISLTCFIACNNRRQRERDFMLKQLDTLNQQLKSFQKEMEPDKYVLYDSVAKKYTEVYLEQFRSTLSDCITYIGDLKLRFAKYCGDKEGLAIPANKEDSIDLTNRFFIKDGNGEILYFRLTDVQKTMSSHNDDPELDKEIQSMTSISEEEGAKVFTRKYFNGIPPVAAMTILSKFVNDIDRLEKKVLQQILKDKNVTPQ